MAKILHRERLYIEAEHVTPLQYEAIEKRFSKQIFQEASCSKCEYLDCRPSETCDACPANLGEFKLFQPRTFRGVDYVGIPQGATKFLNKHFNVADFQVIDKRPAKKFKHKIEFTGTLREHQIPAVKELLEYYAESGGCGTLISPPRSGKTAMATAVICSLGMKTLILAKQIDWLLQFQETFIGSDSQKPLTDIPDTQKFHQTKIIGVCKKLEDFQKYDICLATYQTFLSDNGQFKYKELRDEFPVIVIDEIHTSAAAGFSRILNGFNSYIRLGLTATYDRKDGLHWLVGHIAGLPIHTVEIETLKPTVEVTLTGYDAKLPKSWVFALRNLTRSKERNKLILKHVMADLDEGYSIVIPTTFVKHSQILVKAINKRAGETVAVAFTGKSDRRDIIEGARDGKYKVVVGTRSIIQTGINIPAWNCLYEILPSSNIPNLRQRLSRILTPVPGKAKPLIRYMLDENSLSRRCFTNEFYHGLLPFIKPEISQRTWVTIKAYIANKTAKKNNIVGGEF